MKKKTFLQKIESLQNIEAIQKLMKEMMPLCLNSGIKENTFKSILRIGKERNEERLKEVREFLVELYKKEYLDYKKRYNHVPPHVWANYELYHPNDKSMPEQKLLMEASKQLKDAWKKRPKYKKEKKD